MNRFHDLKDVTAGWKGREGTDCELSGLSSLSPPLPPLLSFVLINFLLVFSLRPRDCSQARCAAQRSLLRFFSVAKRILSCKSHCVHNCYITGNGANKNYLPSVTSGLRFASRHLTTWPGSEKNLAIRGFTSPTETHSELPKSTWNTSTSNKLLSSSFVSSTVQRKLFTRLRYHRPSSVNRAQQ